MQTLDVSVTEYCHQCRKHTRWEPVRGGKALKCDECGDRYPCAHKCAHEDCALVARDGRNPGTVRRQT